MKKSATRPFPRILAFFLLLLLLLPLFTTHALAQTGQDLQGDLMDALPDGLRDTVGDALALGDSGEPLGVEQLLSYLLEALGGALPDTLPFFLRLLALVIAFALLSLLSGELKSEGAARAAECGLCVVLAFFVCEIARADFTHLTATLRDMQAFSLGLIPVFGGLFAMGGTTATAVASAGGFTAFSYLLEQVAVAALTPLLSLLFAFTALSAVGGRIASAGVFSFLRQAYLTLLGLLSFLLVTSLGFQSALATSADSVAAGSLRFAVGNLVPIVGSTLGGTLRTLTATVTLLKSRLGTLAVAALLVSVLPIFFMLLLHRFALSLSSAVATMLGARRAGEIIDGFRSLYDLAIATLAITAVLFFLILGILTGCGVAVPLAG